VEVGADFLHPLADRGFGDAPACADLGHGQALQVGVSEGEVQAIDGEAGAILAADVADEAAGKLERVGIVTQV